jgi:hypothetical protein
VNDFERLWAIAMVRATWLALGLCALVAVLVAVLR